MQEKETVWGALKNFFGAKRGNLLRPNAVLGAIFSPSSFAKEESHQENGLLGVLDQNAELVVETPEHETFVQQGQAVSRASEHETFVRRRFQGRVNMKLLFSKGRLFQGRLGAVP